MTLPSLPRLPLRAAALVIGLLLAVTGCQTAQPGGQQGDQGAAPTVKAALIGDVDTFNPFLAILATSTDILRFQYEPLVSYGTNNEEVPGLAEEWEASDDAKTWTYTIGADRKWSDDTPVTAEDAAYTFSLIKDNPSLQQANGGLVTNVAEVRAVDERTVELVLTAPQASNPGQELPIVPKHVWQDVDDPAEFANDSDTVGSGPFVIKSSATGGTVELVANPHFWRGEPQVSGITFVSYKSTDAAVQGLRTGEIDVLTGLTAAQYDSLADTPDIEVNSGANRRYQSIAINPGAIDAKGKPMGDGNPVLQDVAVRKAIFHAIDKQVLLDRVLKGLGKIGKTEVPTVYPDYYGFAPDTEEFNFDPDEANRLLDEAGYERGDDGIRRDTKGKPIKLRLMGRNTDPTHQQMADFVVPWLKDIGIAVESRMVTPAQVNDDSTLGNYDLYFTGWGIGPDPDFQLSINTCASRPNADGSGATSENNWCSKEFDKLYAAQHAELDKEKRSELVRQAFSELYSAAVSLPLFYADALEAYRTDRFSGFTTQPEEGGIILSQNGYWGLYGATPVEDAGAGGGTPSWAIPVGVLAVLVVVGGVVVAVMRSRGAGADDKE